MRLSTLPQSTLGLSIIALASLGLIIAPFGCETVCLFTDCGDGEFGWFINQDKTSDVLLGAKASSGASLFAYGSFNDNGDIERITAVVLRDADGNESFIAVDDNGRPTHLQAADGSYAHIEYTVATDARVAGQIKLYNAGDESQETIPFDVDLDQTLATVAAQLEQITGQQLEVLPDPNARIITGDSKIGGRNAETVLYPVFLLPFVAMAYMVSYIAAAIVTMVTMMVAAVVQATLVAVLAPVYLLSEVTSAVLFLPYSFVSLPSIFPLLPEPPSVTVLF
jgi:hypothetical protein